jgi:ferredoxin-thioredoxin reductase catalytic subunit
MARDRLLLFALSTGPHCRAARKMLDAMKAPFDILEVDLLPEPEEALGRLALLNPAQTFPTLVGGSRAAAGPLADDFRRLAARFGQGSGAGPGLDTAAPRVAPAPEGYARLNPEAGQALNPDQDWVSGVLAGLAANKARYGYGSCPGRLATGRREGDRDIICPCAFRDEDVAKYGRCHCHLFFSPRGVRGRVTPVPDRWLR